MKIWSREPKTRANFCAGKYIPCSDKDVIRIGDWNRVADRFLSDYGDRVARATPEPAALLSQIDRDHSIRNILLLL